MTTHRHRAGRNRAGSTAEYRAWQSMIYRCENPRSGGWSYYGGKGVRVDPAWRRSFVAFFEDVGPKPIGRYRLERFNKAGDFTPPNVGWVERPRRKRRRGPAIRRCEAGGAVRGAGLRSTTMVYHTRRMGAQKPAHDNP
jgi:hypothetical protein